MLHNSYEIVNKYSQIIGLQKQIIDELFLLLCQHLAAEELDTLPCVDKINLTADIYKDISS